MSTEVVRNRITHPKSADSLLVEDFEVNDAQAAGQWVYDTLGRLLSDIQNGLKSQEQDLIVWAESIQGETMSELLRQLRTAD